MGIAELRKKYHQRICEQIIRFRRDGQTDYPNLADKGNKASRAIAHGIVKRLGCPSNYELLSGQTAGGRFETLTKDFLEQAFARLKHLRPGK